MYAPNKSDKEPIARALHIKPVLPTSSILKVPCLGRFFGLAAMRGIACGTNSKFSFSRTSAAVTRTSNSVSFSISRRFPENSDKPRCPTTSAAAFLVSGFPLPMAISIRILAISSGRSAKPRTAFGNSPSCVILFLISLTPSASSLGRVAVSSLNFSSNCAFSISSGDSPAKILIFWRSSSISPFPSSSRMSSLSRFTGVSVNFSCSIIVRTSSLKIFLSSVPSRRSLNTYKAPSISALARSMLVCIFRTKSHQSFMSRRLKL